MAGKYGDCEDYALAKRNALLNAGWPKDKLGLCVCYTQSGEGHCVLWVDTDKGSFILDNNYDFPSDAIPAFDQPSKDDGKVLPSVTG